MRQYQQRIGCKSVQDLFRLNIIHSVEASSERLAVDADGMGRARVIGMVQYLCMFAKSFLDVIGGKVLQDKTDF